MNQHKKRGPKQRLITILWGICQSCDKDRRLTTLDLTGDDVLAPHRAWSNVQHQMVDCPGSFYEPVAGTISKEFGYEDVPTNDEPETEQDDPAPALFSDES